MEAFVTNIAWLAWFLPVETGRVYKDKIHGKRNPKIFN